MADTPVYSQVAQWRQLCSSDTTHRAGASMHVKATDVSAVQTGGGEIDGCKRDGAEQSFVTEESGKASYASDSIVLKS